GPGGRRARPPLRLGAGRRSGRSRALVRLGGPGPVRGAWEPPVRLGDLPLGGLRPLAGDRGPARLPRLRARDRTGTALRRSGRRHAAPEREPRRELERTGRAYRRNHRAGREVRSLEEPAWARAVSRAVSGLGSRTTASWGAT